MRLIKICHCERDMKPYILGKEGVWNLEDQDIVKMFCIRSEQAIEELSKKYGKLCSNVARNILNDDQDAEECVNDTYLGVWNSVPPKQPDPLLTYVCKITRNLAIKKYHANTAFKRNSCYEVALSELEGCLAAPDSAEAELSAQELTEALNRFLSTLDRENRILFVRRYWYADSISDLAEQFGMSNRNISLRLFRTREKLRSHLVQEGVLL